MLTDATDIIKATEGVSIQALDPRNSFEADLQKRWTRVAFLLPPDLKPEKVFQVFSSTIAQDPKLLECTMQSLMASIMRSACLGLLPSTVDGLGHCFIIPYQDKATFQLGYKGVLELARRSADVLDVYTQVVYQGDEFVVTLGDEAKIVHLPDYSVSRMPEAVTHAYMIMHLTSGGTYREVMTREEIESVRARSQAVQAAKRYGKQTAWDTDYEAMAKKTVISRAKPYIPMSAELRRFWRDADAPEGLSPPDVIDLMMNGSEDAEGTLDEKDL